MTELCRLTSGFGTSSSRCLALGKTPFRNPLLSTYWTEGAVRHGEYVAKVRITPEPSAAAQVRIRDLDPMTNPEAVRDSLVAEIGEHDYTFELQAQLCVDPLRMPIENTSIDWSEKLSPFTKIATIHIPKQDISSPANLDIADRISISPWRTRDDHKPLGEIMTVRREVYRRSAEVRRQINQQPQREPSSLNEVFDWAEGVNKRLAAGSSILIRTVSSRRHMVATRDHQPGPEVCVGKG